MADFKQDAGELLKLVGGRENIVSFTHCATRMRFVLADEKKADVKGIEALDSVKGTFTQGGQFQVIIGNKVAVFFDEFSAISHMEGVDKQEVKQAAKGNMNLLQRAVANLAEVFAPLIPAIVVGGLILGFRNIIGDIKLLDGGTKSITEVSQFWNGAYNFLWLAGEAIFTFLPVGVTWSVCRKMNADQMLGIVLGITLVSPQLMSASDYVAAVEAGDPVKMWDFGSFHINMVGYQSQVIPAMILAHTVIGPFGRMLGDGLAGIIMAGFNSPVNWLFSGIYGLLYPLLVITGLHHAMLPIDLQTAATMGGIYTFPVVALSNIAQATAVAAFVFINRHDAKAKEVGIPAFISGYLGVTEPAMFGVNLKYLYPFVGAMLASGVMGIFSRLAGVIANSVGVGGIPAFLSMRGDKILIYIVCIAADIVLAFLFTLLLSRTKLKDYGNH